MKLEDLTDFLLGHEDWEWGVDPDGVLITNLRFQTKTHLTFKAVEDNTLDTILAACAQGRDVDFITRVTGYMSRASQWNRGKKGELKDRHRVTV